MSNSKPSNIERISNQSTRYNFKTTRAALLTIVVLTGCQSTYSIPNSQPHADIFASAKTDSSVTNARWVWLEAFADEKCGQNPHGIRLGSSPAFSNAGTVTSPPHKIGANQKIVITAAYMDARYAQNRKCAVTAGFTPQADRRYKAAMEVNDDVTACGLGLYDITDNKEERVEFTLPENACLAGDKEVRVNGKPLWTNWNINVTVHPATSK